jgi:hypothetical protein
MRIIHSIRDRIMIESAFGQSAPARLVASLPKGVKAKIEQGPSLGTVFKLPEKGAIVPTLQLTTSPSFRHAKHARDVFADISLQIGLAWSEA